MDHEKFKNVASGVQSTALAAAIVIGGIWSVFVLGDVARARAEVDKLRHSQVALEFSISSEALPHAKDEQRGLIVEVSVKNIGAKYVTLDLRQPSLRASRISFGSDGRLSSAGPPVATHYYGPSILPYSRINLAAGGAGILPFYIEVPSSGVYMFTFESVMSTEPAQNLERLPVGAGDTPLPGPPSWVAQKIVNVQ